MADFGTAILAGVISGLSASVIVLLCGSYWRTMLRPLIEDFVYKGVRINGTWECHVTVCKQDKQQLVVITQKAHRVRGTITYPQDTKGHAHTYTFQGSFFNNVLTALAEEVGKARADRGALMLQLQQGLAQVEMKGLGLWLEGATIVSLGYTWTHVEGLTQPQV